MFFVEHGFLLLISMFVINKFLWKFVCPAQHLCWALEGSHSGLVRRPGKSVWLKDHRGSESLTLRLRPT